LGICGRVSASVCVSVSVRVRVRIRVRVRVRVEGLRMGGRGDEWRWYGGGFVSACGAGVDGRSSEWGVKFRVRVRVRVTVTVRVRRPRIRIRVGVRDEISNPLSVFTATAVRLPPPMRRI